jgi:hypothetical protein
VIGRTVAGNGRPHQVGPLDFMFAHARSHFAIRPDFQVVTSQTP